MKSLCLFVSVAVLSVFSAPAQDYVELIKANPAMAGANMMNYHFEKSVYTPAPKGYKAFYISHYGRHGSRYDTYDDNAVYVWPIMRRLAEAGLFTDAGKAFYKDLDAVLTEQDNMYGMLTSLGAKEQRGIAERMVGNFPDVFRGRNGRRTVFSQSSIVPRCLVSMTNFGLSLDRNTDNLDLQFVTGDKYYNVLSYHPSAKSKTPKKNAVKKEDQVRRETMKPMEIISYFCNDAEKALEIIGDPYKFEQRLYLAASVGHLTDYGVCLLEHFPQDVLVRNFEVRNPRFYLSYGMSDETAWYQQQISKKLLADFVQRADAALEDDSRVAADLRFGHDTALLPFVGHIRIDGMDDWASYDDVNSVWNSSVSICMGSNFQMIFYADKKGDVLVKMMYNEKETTIPALKAFSGPYYKWSDLRSYFVSLL